MNEETPVIVGGKLIGWNVHIPKQILEVASIDGKVKRVLAREASVIFIQAHPGPFSKSD